MSVARDLIAAILPLPPPRRPRADIAAAVAPPLTSAAPDAAQQAQTFLQQFEAQYGAIHPAFIEQSWKDAATAAHRQFKCLLVYLHSSEHEVTEQFCRETLCSTALVAYTRENLVCWGGDIRQPDAFSLSSRLQISSYPAVALLAYSGSRTKLVAAVQGCLGPEQLIGVITRAVGEEEVRLVAERAEIEEREQSRQMIAEQNAEYEAALRADREREAQRERERQAAEAEQRLREEAEAAVRAEEAAAEARRQEAVASIHRRRQSAASSLPPEPSDDEPTAAVRVRLPDGSNHNRRFAAGNTVRQLYAWVDSLEECDYAKYSLVCGFPRKVFGPDTLEQTLEAAGLAPQGVLFVQQEDEEEGQQ